MRSGSSGSRDVNAEALFGALETHAAGIFCQSGEDGSLAFLFRLLGAEGRFFVEFGAKDGRYLSNTANLRLSYGWRGLLLDGSAPSGGGGRPGALSDANAARVQRAFVTAENIDDLFEGYGVPPRFDLLSLDIDGNEYWVWKALERHRPRVVVVEYNIFFGIEDRLTIPYRPQHVWDKTSYHGATLAALRDLGREKGYELVYTDPFAPNAFFVSREELPRDWRPLAQERLCRWGDLGGAPGSQGRPWVEPDPRPSATEGGDAA